MWNSFLPQTTRYTINSHFFSISTQRVHVVRTSSLPRVGGVISQCFFGSPKRVRSSGRHAYAWLKSLHNIQGRHRLIARLLDDALNPTNAHALAAQQSHEPRSTRGREDKKTCWNIFAPLFRQRRRLALVPIITVHVQSILTRRVESASFPWYSPPASFPQLVLLRGSFLTM